MSDGLVAFLRARLDEDETLAKAAPGERWQSFTEDDIAGACVYDEQWRLLDPARYDHDNPMSNRPGATGPQYIQRARDELAAHIACHDPARVLREVEAKRAILALHKPDRNPADEWYGDDVRCDECGGVIWNAYTGERGFHRSWPCRSLRHLAAVYRDHPDYRQEWAP